MTIFIETFTQKILIFVQQNECTISLLFLCYANHHHVNEDHPKVSFSQILIVEQDDMCTYTSQKFEKHMLAY